MYFFYGCTWVAAVFKRSCTLAALVSDAMAPCRIATFSSIGPTLCLGPGLCVRLHACRRPNSIPIKSTSSLVYAGLKSVPPMAPECSSIGCFFGALGWHSLDMHLVFVQLSPAF